MIRLDGPDINAFLLKRACIFTTPDVIEISDKSEKDQYRLKPENGYKLLYNVRQ